MTFAEPNWTAAFIVGVQSHDQPGRPAPYFRTEFDVEPGLVAARLYVTSLGLLEAHLNGSVVGDEVLCPGWSSYAHRTIVSVHDVGALVQLGRNALGAIAGEGWAVGRVSHLGKRNIWADRPAVFLQLELRYPDRIDVVRSDESWRTATGAIVADGLYDGETYDARLEPVGWDLAGFDDRDWTPATALERDPATLVLRRSPPIRRTEELSALAVLDSPTGQCIVDFGQEIAGWVRLRVEGPAGTTVVVRHTELLVDGEPEYEPNRTAEATDRFTLRGGGTEVWEPRFTFHGFRYAVVEGWPGELRAEQASAIVVHSDLVRTGWFESSDDRLNQLHRNVVWSWRGNSVGLPTDSPQRDERLGWTGDINAFGPTAAFLYDVREFLGSWLDDLAAEQRTKGVVPVVIPDVLDMFATPTALWGDVAVSLPWTLYQQYGDTDILRRHYASMKACVDGVAAVLDRRGLWSRGFQFGDWLDPDAPPDQPSRAKAEAALVATAHLCRTTQELAATAQILEDDDDAVRYRELHDETRRAFRIEWVTPAGRLANECQTSYALAICFGVFDPEQERRAGLRLAELVREARFRISTGFAGTPWVAHALSRTGRDDIAYRLLQQTEPPSFLYPVTMGATTIWERWDSVLPDGRLNSTGMTSLNHYALGAIGDWMHRRIGGLRPLEPGYRVIEVAPRPGGGLTWARTELDTVHGRVSCAWRDADGSRRVDVTVPDGTVARVVLPGHPDELVEEVGPGDRTWSYAIEREGFDFTTPFDVLREQRDAWTALHELLGTLMPGVPNLLDHLADSAPNLASALPHLAEATPEFEDELRKILAAARNR